MKFRVAKSFGSSCCHIFRDGYFRSLCLNSVSKKSGSPFDPDKLHPSRKDCKKCLKELRNCSAAAGRTTGNTLPRRVRTNHA